MGDIVKAKLFTHGGGQAVRLPKALRRAGEPFPDPPAQPLMDKALDLDS